MACSRIGARPSKLSKAPLFVDKLRDIVGRCFRRHRSQEFRQFLELLDLNAPGGLDVHLILDNYGTHKTATIHRWLLHYPRFHHHFTPTGSSWINVVERWFAELTNKPIRRGTHHSTRQLESAIYDYIEHCNETPKLFVWTKTADQILENLVCFCKRIITTHDTSPTCAVARIIYSMPPAADSERETPARRGGGSSIHM